MRLITTFAAAGLGVLLAGAAQAQANMDFQPARAGDWIVTARATSISSGANDPILTAAGAATGLNVDVSADVMPTLGFTYFLTDHVSVEAILGATQHEVHAQGPGGSTLVHETWVLPPVVTVQYRPTPYGRVSPYVGAGVNYMLFFDGENHNGFDVELEDGFGFALQAGADLAISGPWSLNLDVKKVWFDTEATINGGALTSDVALDPWVVSLGVGRRF